MKNMRFMIRDRTHVQADFEIELVKVAGMESTEPELDHVRILCNQ